MALVISDRVKETTTTSGTGTYTLGGAVTGFETFTANLSDGDTTYYACTDNVDFEVGLGTFTASGTTLSRTTILASSNSNNAVSWSSGTRTIFCTLPASKTLFLDASGNATVSGTLDVTGETTLATHLNMGDNDIIKLGASADLQIYHDAFNSYIEDVGTGSLIIRGTDIFVQDREGNNFIHLDDTGTGGTVTIYHDNVAKLATTSTGIDVTGNATFSDNDKVILGDGSDLQIYHDAFNSYIAEQGTGSLIVRGSNLNIQDTEGNNYAVMTDNGTGGTVTLYHDASAKLATTSTGVTVTGAVTAGSFVIGSADINENDLEAIDGITAGTVAASKAAIVDINKDITGFRNVTLTGELDAATLDISGNADIDGTLEADAITVNGTALNTVIAGVTVTNATNATNAVHVSVADNESTDEENLITFIEDASATGNVGLESDGNFSYNPSTGTVSATIFKGNIDAVDGDFDGTLEADAITLNGTAITATATLDTGISNNNVPKFTTGVADDDFLRVAGTVIEGRSASEVRSDISAITLTEASEEATALAIALG